MWRVLLQPHQGLRGLTHPYGDVPDERLQWLAPFRHISAQDIVEQHRREERERIRGIQRESQRSSGRSALRPADGAEFVRQDGTVIILPRPGPMKRVKHSGNQIPNELLS